MTTSGSFRILIEYFKLSRFRNSQRAWNCHEGEEQVRILSLRIRNEAQERELLSGHDQDAALVVCVTMGYPRKPIRTAQTHSPTYVQGR